MATVFLYGFIFLTWGLGLLSWIAALSRMISRLELERQERTLELSQKTLLLNKFNFLTNGGGGKGLSIGGLATQIAEPNKTDIADNVKELMKSSPNHPEVEEIDSSDEILGIRFEAENYPPGFGEESQ